MMDNKGSRNHTKTGRIDSKVLSWNVRVHPLGRDWRRFLELVISSRSPIQNRAFIIFQVHRSGIGGIVGAATQEGAFRIR